MNTTTPEKTKTISFDLVTHTSPRANTVEVTVEVEPFNRRKFWTKFPKDSDNSFVCLYAMQPVDRADLIKERAPSAMVPIFSKEMDITKDRFVQIMGFSRSTMTRKIASKADLSVDESERLVGLAKLIGQVKTMVKESGNPDGFNPAKWLSGWMEQPAAALGGRKPEDLLDTSDGREAVSKLLSQMQSGAYA